MKVKAAEGPLAQGSLTLAIKGFAGQENFKIRVNGEEISVIESKSKPDFELDHGPAMRFLFGLLSAERASLVTSAAQWFPLPLNCMGFDSV